MPHGLSRAAPGDTRGRLASPLRPPQRALYLHFSIRDGCQILGVPGDGYGPDTVTFRAAVKYCVYRNAAKQNRGGDKHLPRGTHFKNITTVDKQNVVYSHNGMLAIKRMEVWTGAAMWMSLANSVLCEKSRSLTEKRFQKFRKDKKKTENW